MQYYSFRLWSFLSLILDFINVTKKPAYGYLESSITQSVIKMMQQEYAFKRMNANRLKYLAKTNYIFHDEFYTKTAALNLGLLGKQDIVIFGGYTVIKKANNRLVIRTRVNIYDIKKKKIINMFSMDGPADSRIWSTVKAIAGRIVKETKHILPNKEEWQRKGFDDNYYDTPVFEKLVLGLVSFESNFLNMKCSCLSIYCICMKHINNKMSGA